MPVKQLVKEADLPFALRDYVANFVYVGVLAYLLEIELDEIKAALDWNFAGKQKPIDMNYNMAMAAYDWAKENLTNDQPFRAERMSGYNEGKVMVDGNQAAALGRHLQWRRSRVLVSDHALVEPGRKDRRVRAQVAHAIPNRARRPMPSSRPRTSWRPSAWLSAPVGRAHGP